MALSNLSTAARNAACDSIVDLLDGGTIEIYTAAFGTLLAVLTFGTPAFGAASTGVATANAITADSSANATGTAAVCRIKNSSSAVVFEGTVGTSGADVNLNTVSITTADTVSITSMTVTMPAA